MHTANKTERKFLQALIRSSKSLDYKIEHHWAEGQRERAEKLSKMDKVKVWKMNTLIKIVSAYYGISVADLRGHSRKSHLITPRYVFCEIAHKKLLIGFIPIGCFLNGRNHSTIVDAVNKVMPAIEFNDPEVTEDIKNIIELYERTVR